MKELVLANLATISLANLPFSQQPAAISSTLIEDAVTTWMCHITQLNCVTRCDHLFRLRRYIDEWQQDLSRNP